MDNRDFTYETARAESRRLAVEHVQEQQDAARRSRIERIYGAAKLPARFRGRSFETLAEYDRRIKPVKRAAQNYARRFSRALETGASLALVGAPGTGKTHTACAILEAVIAAGHLGLFATMSDILRAFRSVYSGDGPTEGQILDYYSEPDLLVVDEIGVAIGSLDKTRAILFDVFDRRYRDRKPVIVVGNHSPAELAAYLGERIYRRILEGGSVLAFDWAPYRGQA